MYNTQSGLASLALPGHVFRQRKGLANSLRLFCLASLQNLDHVE